MLSLTCAAFGYFLLIMVSVFTVVRWYTSLLSLTCAVFIYILLIMVSVFTVMP